ncbi:MAG TPA: hypothetical protein VFQ53_04410 [Kofleriaceae bacterium]|nr:hypothetical protein [Kofleriaceae bacterium]
MKLAIALGLVACSGRGPSSDVCEDARAHAVANERRYIADVLATARDDERPELAAQAARELHDLDARFVATCRSFREFRADCFDSPEREHADDCRAFIKAFVRAALR